MPRDSRRCDRTAAPLNDPAVARCVARRARGEPRISARIVRCRSRRTRVDAAESCSCAALIADAKGQARAAMCGGRRRSGCARRRGRRPDCATQVPMRSWRSCTGTCAEARAVSITDHGAPILVTRSEPGASALDRRAARSRLRRVAISGARDSDRSIRRASAHVVAELDRFDVVIFVSGHAARFALCR